MHLWRAARWLDPLKVSQCISRASAGGFLGVSSIPSARAIGREEFPGEGRGRGTRVRALAAQRWSQLYRIYIWARDRSTEVKRSDGRHRRSSIISGNSERAPSSVLPCRVHSFFVYMRAVQHERTQHAPVRLSLSFSFSAFLSRRDNALSVILDSRRGSPLLYALWWLGCIRKMAMRGDMVMAVLSLTQKTAWLNGSPTKISIISIGTLFVFLFFFCSWQCV